MYGMTNTGKMFVDDITITNSLMNVSVLQQSQYKMYIHYKHAPDGSKWVELSYDDDCVFWYTYQELRKWFVDTLGKRFHENLLGYAHWFMSIRISKLKEYSISVDQAKYATYIVSKYIEIDTME